MSPGLAASGTGQGASVAAEGALGAPGWAAAGFSPPGPAGAAAAEPGELGPPVLEPSCGPHTGTGQKVKSLVTQVCRDFF